MIYSKFSGDWIPEMDSAPPIKKEKPKKSPKKEPLPEELFTI